MKKKLVIALSLLNLSACAQIKSSDMESNTKQEEERIITTVRQLAKLMIERDTTSMNEILDEHYTLTHITGYVQPKSQWFNEVEKESMKYYSANEITHSITIKGNRADVTVQNMIDARIWGSRNTWRLQQKMKLEKRNGNWIILQSIASTF